MDAKTRADIVRRLKEGQPGTTITKECHVGHRAVTAIRRGMHIPPKRGGPKKLPKRVLPYAQYRANPRYEWCDVCGAMVAKPCLACYLRSLSNR